MNAMTPITAPNGFRQWWDQGYHDLIPVVPADAKCVPSSHVSKGVGKSPGSRYSSGLWGGFKGWNEHQTTETDLNTWHGWGASIGLRIGDAWMLDLDVYDRDTAEMIEAKAIEMLGPAPQRIGMWPKRSLLYRSAGDIKPKKMQFAGKSGEVNNIEIPFQSVVQGIHPKTQKPYSWPRAPKALAELTVVSLDQVLAFMRAMKALLPGASDVSGAGEAVVDQDGLRGHPDVIADIMHRLPNLATMRWDYMVRLGYALNAALPDDLELAFELWDDWCMRWEGDGGYDPDVQRVRWDSFKGPYRAGAKWLYEEGERLIGAEEQFDARAILWDGKTLDEMRNAPEPEPDILTGEQKSAHDLSDVYPVVDVTELVRRPPPKMLVARHIPQQSVGFVYGEPGSFKSFITLDIALHIAAGMPAWNGDALDVPDGSIVVYLAFEGAFGMRNRILAWCSEKGVDPAVLASRFKMIEVPINFMKPEQIQKLMRTVRTAMDGVPCWIVADTVSRALPGADENGQKDMTMFVHACDALRMAFGCAVTGVHHANKQGSDMRGSTVLRGAGDYVFRMTKRPDSTLVVLDCEKQKDLPSDWKDTYAAQVVPLGDGESSLVFERLADEAIRDVDVTPDLARRVLLAMRADWEAGDPWGTVAQTKERWAIRRMSSRFDVKAHKAEPAIKAWLDTGVIEIATADARNKTKGYRVLLIPETQVQPVSNVDLFD